MAWKKCVDELPSKDGRYFVLVDFDRTVYVLGKAGKENIASASNFFENKWLSNAPGWVITHWMEVPPLEKEC
jgi:hypothetical protein